MKIHSNNLNKRPGLLYHPLLTKLKEIINYKQKQENVLYVELSRYRIQACWKHRDSSFVHNVLRNILYHIKNALSLITQRQFKLLENCISE
jgi:hypothetical protein